MALAAASASAQDWGNLATISSTLGVNANRLCVGEGLRAGDIGCPTYAPYVSTSGNVGIGTTNPQKILDIASGISGGARVRLNETADTAGVWSGLDLTSSGTFKGGLFKQGSTHEISLWDGSLARLTVKQGGNVVSAQALSKPRCKSQAHSSSPTARRLRRPPST
jgi:hypothetical protein